MSVPKLLFVAALLLLAIGSALLALLGFVVLCRQESTSCPDGDANAALTWQLVLALVALALSFPAMWTFTGERPRVAGVLIAGVLALLVVWAVLLDLATHGGRFTLLTEALILAGVVVGTAVFAVLSRARRGT